MTDHFEAKLTAALLLSICIFKKRTLKATDFQNLETLIRSLVYSYRLSLIHEERHLTCNSLFQVLIIATETYLLEKVWMEFLESFHFFQPGKNNVYIFTGTLQRPARAEERERERLPVYQRSSAGYIVLNAWFTLSQWIFFLKKNEISVKIPPR